MRSPQIPFNSASLQGYFNTIDGGINVLTDQLNEQYFAVSLANGTPYLIIKRAFAPSASSIGIYSAPDPSSAPTRYSVFTAGVLTGWFAECAFPGPGILRVSLFDENAIFQGSNTYSGFDRTIVGWYLENASGTYYSQDGLNGGRPQVLTFAGTGLNALQFWECFEGSPYSGGASTFTAAVLEVDQPGTGEVNLCATPVRRSTWGSLKAIYR